MTPAETLAAARGNVVGPYVPAREGWLEGWVGPINIAREAGDPPSAYLCGVWLSNAAEIIGERIGYGVSDEYGNPDYARVLLDLRRPEVRDLLVRRGAPAWARDIPAALWVWATMGAVRGILAPWSPYQDMLDRRWCAPKVSGPNYTRANPDGSRFGGWGLHFCAFKRHEHGPEQGDIGRACADVAALRAGCVLEESDGWLVPTPDGGIGFWPKTCI